MGMKHFLAKYDCTADCVVAYKLMYTVCIGSYFMAIRDLTSQTDLY